MTMPAVIIASAAGTAAFVITAALLGLRADRRNT